MLASSFSFLRALEDTYRHLFLILFFPFGNWIFHGNSGAFEKVNFLVFEFCCNFSTQTFPFLTFLFPTFPFWKFWNPMDELSEQSTTVRAGDKKEIHCAWIFLQFSCSNFSISNFSCSNCSFREILKSKERSEQSTAAAVGADDKSELPCVWILLQFSNS